MTVNELKELLKNLDGDRELMLSVEEYWRPLKRLEFFTSPSSGAVYYLSDEEDR